MNPKRRTVSPSRWLRWQCWWHWELCGAGRAWQYQIRLHHSVGHSISFGVFGITPGQTARINVANLIAPNDPNYRPARLA